MFSPTFDPLHNIWLSGIIAAIPITLFLLGLTIFKMKGINAALMTLVVTIILSIYPFNLPLDSLIASIIQGMVIGLWPIGYIIIMAVWLYRIIVSSGKFEVIKASLTMLSPDQRIQLLLIGFCFGVFLEGAAGFGVPIAICGIMLVALGFNPLKATMLCLIANGSSGPFGAIGIPIAVIDTFALEGVTAHNVSQAMTTTMPIISFIVPFIMVGMIDGLKGIKETLPALLVTSITFVISQSLIIYFMGPELGDILPALISLVALAVLSKYWQPKNIFRVNSSIEEDIVNKHFEGSKIFIAWLPFILLSVAVILWSLPIFKELFKSGGLLQATNLSWVLVSNESGVISTGISFISATGTAILVAIIITIIISLKTLTIKQAYSDLTSTVKKLWISIITICVILAIAKLATFTGMTNALGQVISVTGVVFPLLAPILGWIGVFMTGSVVNNNTLFAPIQYIASNNLGIDPSVMVAANTVGGSIGKLVSPQSIAIATAAVGESGKESQLLKMVLKTSIGLLIFVMIWTFVVVQTSKVLAS